MKTLIESKQADFGVRNEGSIFLLWPQTDAAKAWVADNIGDDVTYYGGAIVIECRYMWDIKDGVECDGLTFEDA